MSGGFLYRLLGIFLNVLHYISPSAGGKLGFRFFCSPARKKINKTQFEFLHSAKESKILFHGKKIHLYQWGNGPKKILFIHGWQSSTIRWKAYIEALSQDEEYTLMAYDAPAHGQSEGKRFTVTENASLMNRLLNDFGDFHAVIAHSIGSFSFFYAKAKYLLPPIEKLIILAPPAYLTEFIGFYKNALKLKPSTVNSITEEFQIRVKEDLHAVSIPFLVKDLTIPGLIIHDTKDDLTDYSNARLLHQHWPISELVTTNGLGHRLRSHDVINAVTDYVKN
jgi:pimeloyl-ACP methyl ester carboxylesterase